MFKHREASICSPLWFIPFSALLFLFSSPLFADPATDIFREGNFLFEKGEYQQAIPLLEKALDSKPSSSLKSQILLTLGISKAVLEDYEGAMIILKDLNNEKAIFWIAMAQTGLAEKQTGAARLEFLKAAYQGLEKCQSSPALKAEATHRHALIGIQLGEIEKTKADFEQILTSAPPDDIKEPYLQWLAGLILDGTLREEKERDSSIRRFIEKKKEWFPNPANPNSWNHLEAELRIRAAKTPEDYDLAATLYEQSGMAEPETRLKAAGAYWKAKNSQKAITLLQDDACWSSATPSLQKKRLQLLALALAQDAANLRSLTELITQYEKLYPGDNGIAPARETLARLNQGQVGQLDAADHLIEAGQYEEAVRLYEKILADSPHQEIPIRTAIGATWLKAGQPEKAVPVFQDVLKKKPDHLDAMILLALAHQAGGHPVECKKILEEITSQYSGKSQAIRAHSLLGDIEDSSGEPRKAIAHWAECKTPESIRKIGKTMSRLESMSLLTPEDKTLLESMPAARATFECESFRWSTAITLLEKLIPPEEDDLLRLGKCYLRTGDPLKALEVFKKAPPSVAAEIGKAGAWAGLGKKQDALQILEKIKNLNTEAILTKAGCLEGKEAIEIYTQVLQRSDAGNDQKAIALKGRSAEKEKTGDSTGAKLDQEKARILFPSLSQ